MSIFYHQMYHAANYFNIASSGPTTKSAIICLWVYSSPSARHDTLDQPVGQHLVQAVCNHYQRLRGLCGQRLSKEGGHWGCY